MKAYTTSRGRDQTCYTSPQPIETARSVKVGAGAPPSQRRAATRLPALPGWLLAARSGPLCRAPRLSRLLPPSYPSYPGRQAGPTPSLPGPARPGSLHERARLTQTWPELELSSVASCRRTSVTLTGLLAASRHPLTPPPSARATLQPPSRSRTRRAHRAAPHRTGRRDGTGRSCANET